MFWGPQMVPSNDSPTEARRSALFRWYTLTAPVYLAVFVMRHLDNPWDSIERISLLAAILLLVATTASAVKRKRWIVLLTHLCVPIYWFLVSLAVGD